MKQGQIALITGATSGIGEAIARQLVADGFIVYGAGRRIENKPAAPRPPRRLPGRLPVRLPGR